MMKAISIILSSLLLSSCASFGSGVTIKSAVIFGVTKTTTRRVLTETYVDLDKRLDAAAKLMFALDTYVLPILSNPHAMIDQEVEALLFERIPVQYRDYILLAVDGLSNYYVSPVADEFLSNASVRYLRSFFSGVREAASDLLNENNKVINIRINVVDEGLTTPH